MATTRASKGQTAKVFFGVAFTDATGAAVDPSGTPTLKVFYVEPAGSLTLKATLNLTIQGAITGSWGAFLDISNYTTYPAGDYQIVVNATVSAIATILTDTFEIDESATSISGGFIAGAYCSEAQVRAVTTMLGTSVVAAFSSLEVVEKANFAARELDGRLRAKYVVPFSSPYDDTIVLINMWLATAWLLEGKQGQTGNRNEMAATVRARAEEWIEDILNGSITLSVAPRTDSADGTETTGGFSIAQTFTRDPAACSDLSRF